MNEEEIEKKYLDFARRAHKFQVFRRKLELRKDLFLIKENIYQFIILNSNYYIYIRPSDNKILFFDFKDKVLYFTEVIPNLPKQVQELFIYNIDLFK